MCLKGVRSRRLPSVTAAVPRSLTIGCLARSICKPTIQSSSAFLHQKLCFRAVGRKSRIPIISYLCVESQCRTQVEAPWDCVIPADQHVALHAITPRKSNTITGSRVSLDLVTIQISDRAAHRTCMSRLFVRAASHLVRGELLLPLQVPVPIAAVPDLQQLLAA